MFRRLAAPFLAIAAIVAATSTAALAQSARPTPTPTPTPLPQDTAPPPLQEAKWKETQQKAARGSKEL